MTKFIRPSTISLLLLSLASVSAWASGVSNVTTELMVLSSDSVLVGKVQSFESKTQACQRQDIFRYQVLRTLKGQAPLQGVFVDSYPLMEKDCPSVHVIRYPCAVPRSQEAVGSSAIFYVNREMGDSCDLASKEAEVTKILFAEPTTEHLIGQLNECRKYPCVYIEKLLKQGDAVVAPLVSTIQQEKGLTTKGEGGLKILGQLKSEIACQGLETLFSGQKDQSQEYLIVAEMGRGGCKKQLPRLRERLNSKPPDAVKMTLIQAMTELSDPKVASICMEKLFDPEWQQVINVLADCLVVFDHDQAAAAMCKRLRQGALNEWFQRKLQEAIQKLGGQCL